MPNAANNASRNDANLHAIQFVIAVLLLVLNVAMLSTNWPSAMMTASTVIAVVNLSIVWLLRKLQNAKRSRTQQLGDALTGGGAMERRP